jgi:glycosyltransferase involved in cell wall biosynthesis
MKNKITTLNNSKTLVMQKRNNATYLNFNFKKVSNLPEILFVTSYPPRECGIATYSQDLIAALNNKFKKSFDIKIAALQLTGDNYDYPDVVKYTLDTDNSNSYEELAKTINSRKIELVVIQHEFGLFKSNEEDFLQFLKAIKKPIVLGLHTVLPNPDTALHQLVQQMDSYVESFIVMTKASEKLLINDYQVDKHKITVIPHGTHLIEYKNKEDLKEKYQVGGRKIISTFGLLSSGKCIETTLNALESIVKKEPNVLFLVIGKTHPTVLKNEGESYRESLIARITELHLENNVQFVNKYLPLGELLEYLQLTDIYLFTSKDRNQAVSGTFSYAIGCGCPIISTPIPHAVEVLESGSGIIVDFENPQQLAEQVIRLLGNDELRAKMAANGIHKLAPTVWENSALAHVAIFKKLVSEKMVTHYKIPEINLKHFKNLTTSFGMIQFSIINQPDINSGYTLDDNARALVAMCQHYKLTNDKSDLEYIQRYFNFIKFCLQTEGYFLNYVDKDRKFTKQNSENLADSNGRAIWALGYLLSISDLISDELTMDAQKTLQKSLINVHKIYSPRAIAFIIKGIHYSNTKNHSFQNTSIIRHLADRLVQMYRHEASPDWLWFESYLTYGNAILPEAMLCAYMETGDETYKKIAQTTFDYLLTTIFRKNTINVVSNKGWLHSSFKSDVKPIGGEQPIDVAYTILALSTFFKVFNEVDYLQKMEIAFSWFMGKNHLNQIIYNPRTGGCYDGLEEEHVNLNQGAESTVSYLMARLEMENQFNNRMAAKDSYTRNISQFQSQNQRISS